MNDSPRRKPINVTPSPDPQLSNPLHQIALVVNGIFLLENLRLDELAAQRAYEFALMVQPLKLVGATAHYVTADLDEGPIIEQEVIRVDHTYDPRALSTVGQDAEALALSRAVRWHCEHRVLLEGTSTVVFR